MLVQEAKLQKKFSVFTFFPTFARLKQYLKQNHKTFNMKKFLFLVVAMLLVGRMTAQTIDTTNLDQHDVPTVILLDSDFEESSTSVNDASTLLSAAAFL